MSQPDHPPIEKLGAYRLVRLLGRGGMGEVWQAVDERSQRLVAIKRIRPEVAKDASRRERFRREARLVARLHHPHVVQVFELLEREDGDALVMEYVEGPSLFEVLREGPLTPRRVVDLAAAMSDGLEAAHEAGLVHRDLKSGNVLVSRGDDVKILDFGLAKPLDPDPDASLTGERDLLGTAHAMAPEQILGEKVDARTDLFALGSLLYEMLTGVPPFRAATLNETLRDILVRGPREPLREKRPSLPTTLYELVDELHAKDPDERPESAALVARRLREIAGELRAKRATEPPLSELDERPTMAGPRDRPAPGSATTEGLAESSEVRSRDTGNGLRRFSTAARLAAGLLLVALVAGSIVVVGRFDERGALARGPAPLRVAVPWPNATEDGGGWLAIGVMVEVQRGLLALEGITPVDSAALEHLDGHPLDVARAVAADEVLSATLGVEDGFGLISLRRLRTDNGEVIWAEDVRVPATPEAGIVMANAVVAALRRAYPDRALRPGAPDLEVRGQD